MRPAWPELPVDVAIAACVTVTAVWTELRWSPYPIHGAAVAYALAVSPPGSSWPGGAGRCSSR